MKSEWQKNIEWQKNVEEEFNAKEADFLARQPKPTGASRDLEKQHTAKTGGMMTEADKGREQREKDELHTEDQIRTLMGYGNVETAREKEIKFDVKNRMFREGWEVDGRIDLPFESDLMQLLAGVLNNEGYRIVILPKEKQAIIFHARKHR